MFFLPIVIPPETSEMLRHLCIHYAKLTRPRPQVFWVNGSIIWQFCCIIDVISSHIAKVFQIWSTIAGYDELCVGF